MQWVSTDVKRMLQQQRQAGHQHGDEWSVEQRMQLRDIDFDTLNGAERCVCRGAFLIQELNKTPDVPLQQQVQRLVLSEDLLRCMVSIITIVSFREVRDAQRGTPSSSSSSSSSSSTGGAGQRGDQPPLRYTPSNTRLLQLLHLNAESIELMDHEFRHLPRCRGFMFALLMGYSYVAAQWCDHAQELLHKQLLLLVQLDALLPGTLPCLDRGTS
jgi:hypothetical protein